MKMHPSVINKLLYLASNYGGHKDEEKLISHYKNIVLSPYLREDGTICLVDAKELLEERAKRQLPVGDVIPMRFHSTALAKIMQLYGMYGGYKNEVKLRKHFSEVDLTTYERTQTENDVVLVLTSEYLNVLQSVGRRE
jgi:hypothetical protein